MSEAQFRAAFKTYGVPWRGAPGSSTAAITDVLLRLFRWAVSVQKRTIGPKGHTYCDILENPTFNALATTYRGHDLVTLFGGAINFIFSAYFTFLSDPKSLASLGHTSGHVTPPEALDSIRACRVIYTTDHLPKDRQRVDAAHDLAILTCFFILLHEVGHVVSGHPLFLQRRYGLNIFEEVASQENQDQLDARMAFEWEADEYAADASYQLMRHMMNAGSFPALKDIHPDMAWSIAASMTFFLIAHISGGNIDKKSVTHPRPIHRCTWSMLTVEGSKSCKAFSPDGDRFRNGIEEVLGWFLRNDLGIHAQESWESQVEDLQTEYGKAKQFLRNKSLLLDAIAAERRQAAEAWRAANFSQ